MTRRLPYLIVAVAVLALPGCSYTCKFEGRGVVREAATGEPVPNAQVELINEDGRSLAGPVATNSEGEFQINFTTVPAGRDHLTGWQLVLKAEGFEPQTIPVGPVREPQRGDVTVHLVFHAALRKAR